MQAEVRKLLVKHCATLQTEIEEISTILSGIDQGAGPGQEGPLLAAGIARVHKIKGSSGSIGFMKVSAAARELEMTLRTVAEGRIPGTTARSAVARNHAVLAELIADVRPEDSRLFAADFSLFENNPLPGANRR